MKYLDKIKETIATELTKKMLASLLPLIGTCLLAFLPILRDQILPAIPRWLLTVLLGISITLNLILFAYIHSLNKNLNTVKDEAKDLKNSQNKKFKIRFGIYWDNELNPICPNCELPLMLDNIGTPIASLQRLTNPLEPQPKLNCSKCGKKFHLVNDLGMEISFFNAKQELLMFKFL